MQHGVFEHDLRRFVRRCGNVRDRTLPCLVNFRLHGDGSDKIRPGSGNVRRITAVGFGIGPYRTQTGGRADERSNNGRSEKQFYG